MKYIFINIILSIFLTGCATNPYTKFYIDSFGGKDVTKEPQAILPTGEPVIFRGNKDYEKDSISMIENGYIMLGYSSFNAGNVNEDDAKYQAKKIHASAIVMYSKYTNTVSGSIPLTLPNTTTTNSSVYGNVYGSGGYANVSGYGTSTTYGTKTTYIPYSVRRSDYSATYWIKSKGPIFGAYPKEIEPETHKKIGTNKGVAAYAIVKKSPAFHADIFTGDILLKIDDADIYDVKTYADAITKYSGHKVDIQIYRDGKIITKKVKLNTRYD